jgi:hypothetical protein
MTGRILVLGVGNELLRDEGLGVRAVRSMERENWPDNVEFLEGATFTRTSSTFAGNMRPAVLDVACFGGGPAEVGVLGEEDLTEARGPRCSLHEWTSRNRCVWPTSWARGRTCGWWSWSPEIVPLGSGVDGSWSGRPARILEAGRGEIRRAAADCAGVSPGTSRGVHEADGLA